MGQDVRSYGVVFQNWIVGCATDCQKCSTPPLETFGSGPPVDWCDIEPADV